MSAFHLLLQHNVLATLAELLEILYLVFGCCLSLYPLAEYSWNDSTLWPTLFVKTFRSPLGNDRGLFIHWLWLVAFYRALIDCWLSAMTAANWEMH